MPVPSKFAHVVYRTRRFEEMLAWYEQVFGARVLCRNPMLAFLTYDDEHHRFAFLNLSEAKPAAGDNDERSDIGVDHVAYTYAGPGELLETYARLKQAGIEPYWAVHHGVTLSLYYSDPDGNRMEFQVNRFATAEESMAYVEGEEFAANPVGVAFDPDELLEQYRRGVAEDVLLAMPDGPPSPLPPEVGLDP